MDPASGLPKENVTKELKSRSGFDQRSKDSPAKEASSPLPQRDPVPSEPSMEEILASIRRMIVEEDEMQKRESHVSSAENMSRPKGEGIPPRTSVFRPVFDAIETEHFAPLSPLASVEQPLSPLPPELPPAEALGSTGEQKAQRKEGVGSPAPRFSQRPQMKDTFLESVAEDSPTSLPPRPVRKEMMRPMVEKIPQGERKENVPPIKMKVWQNIKESETSPSFSASVPDPILDPMAASAEAHSASPLTPPSTLRAGSKPALSSEFLHRSSPLSPSSPPSVPDMPISSALNYGENSSASLPIQRPTKTEAENVAPGTPPSEQKILTSPAALSSKEALLNSVAEEVIEAAFENLDQTLAKDPPLLDQEIVTDLLKPMLKAWLDANLSRIVEQLVQAEIKRIVYRKKLMTLL